MSLAINRPGIIDSLFTPLPETEAVTNDKDHFDHVADYADSTQGAWDLFRFIDYTFSYVKMLPSISPNWVEVIGKTQEVANTVGIGLSIPKIISDCNNLRHNISRLFIVQDLPYSDPLRSIKISHAVKKSFLDLVDFTNTLSQAALFADNAKAFIFEASYLRIIDGVYNVTSVISDGSELITECFKLKHFHSPEAQPRNQAESTKLEERKKLSWMTIAKDIASIGGAAIALIGIVFEITTQGMALLSGAALLLSSVWLTMKIASYFYNKIVVGAPIESRNWLIASFV